VEYGLAAQGFRITPLHEDIPSRLAGRDDFMISSNTTDRLLLHAGMIAGDVDDIFEHVRL
jgi:hypothetical protein